MAVPFTHIDFVLRRLHRQLLDEQETEKLPEWKMDHAMCYTFDMSCSNHGFEKDGNTQHPDWERHDGTLVHVIITKHHRVAWLAFSPNPIDKVQLKEFVHMSSHDDCVFPNISSTLFEKYYEMWETCYGHVPKEHQKPPVMASFHIWPDTFAPFVTSLVISHDLDPEGKNPSYSRKITKLEKVKRTIVL